jgi:TatA/E family protein of Tat protein translocase
VDAKIQPLLPALKSNWLIAHVITCFIGYAAFAVSTGLSILYLFKRSRSADSSATGVLALIPDSRQLDEINYQMILFGFLWLSLGIITGSVWANSAWGNYWSWDPKETWSLITWLIYAAVLHARTMQGWQTGCMVVDARFWVRFVHLLWCELSIKWFAQLRRKIITRRYVMMGLGFPELLVILVLIFFLVGGKKLPQIGEGIGKSIAEFKKAMRDPELPGAKSEPPATEQEKQIKESS